MKNKANLWLAIGITLMTLGLPGNVQAQLVITNDTLRLAYDAIVGKFTLAPRKAGQALSVKGTLSGVEGPGRRVPVSDEVFGKGQAIEVNAGNGTGGQMMLFPRLPFALFRTTLKNTASQTVVRNHVPVVMFQVETALPAAGLKTLGTGGLESADKNPGSYAWLAVADPLSRNGVVAGWLTQERASGVLLPGIDQGRVGVTAQGEYGRLRLTASQSATTETLAIGCFEDTRLGLEAWADAVARHYHIKLPPQPDGFCTWYTEKHGGSSDQKSLADLTEYSANKLKPYGFSFVQIDDGWQLGDSKSNGPNKNFTGYNPHGPYAAGMKAMADTVKAHGMTPGIWFMPFAGTHNDPWFAGHQDWFIKREDDAPYDTAWGGTSLDMTNPAAQAYLRGIVHRIAKEWGYTYFKMDGLYTGTASNQVYVNSGYKEDHFGDAVFADPNKTNVEAFRTGLKLVREEAGPGVFFLGCTVTQNMRSYGASIGLVDAMRIGPDNNGSWGGWLGASPVFGSRNYFLNGRIWYNDPDPNYVRASLSLDEARTIASWSAISGQLNSNSDWIPDLPAERLDILKRTMPSHGRTARPVDLFENEPPRYWTVTDDHAPTRRDVIALYNWSDQAATVDVPTAPFGLPPATHYAAFDYWGNRFLPPFQDHVQATLPPHACQIMAVRPLLGHPFLLSTSRHLTQGIVDVSEEKWSAAHKELSGKSRPVAGDPYELRIYAPAGTAPWKAIRAEVSPEDRKAGVTIRMHQESEGVRAEISSPSSRTVAWKVAF